jgi:non-ribosomal peptide synthetase-like protein
MEPEASKPCWSPGLVAAQTACVLFLPFVLLAAVLPGMMAITQIAHLGEGYSYLACTPVLGCSFILFMCLGVWSAKWLLVGRLREGRFPIDGLFHLRRWFVDRLLAISFDVTETLYETMFIQPWLGALGAQVGARAEVAAAAYLQPDLLEIGEECMIADLAVLSAPRVRSGWMTLGKTRFGKRAFVGNGAVIAGGSDVGDKALIGAFTTVPALGEGPVPPGSSWFGSPPLSLPSRYQSDAFQEDQTFRPGRRLVAQRLVVEFFRIILPSTMFIVLASLIIDITDVLQDHIGLLAWLGTVPFLYLGAGLLAILAVAALKWVLVGRYRPGQMPLWCGFVWRSDLVTGLFNNLCGIMFLGMLRGTPFISWALKLFGMKFGHRCYVDTLWFTEFDLVEVGDEAALNDNSNMQTHLFEDRIMKMDRVRVGPGCTIGANSTVLYGSTLEEGVHVDELSLVMAGERLPAGTSWHGIPARPRGEPSR